MASLEEELAKWKDRFENLRKISAGKESHEVAFNHSFADLKPNADNIEQLKEE